VLSAVVSVWADGTGSGGGMHPRRAQNVDRVGA
jgi:hypothetical protein